MSELHDCCCICMDEFTRPVSLPCAHVFCLGCIGEYWRHHCAYQCPLCKASFPTMPLLKILDQTQSAAGQQSENEKNAIPYRTGEVSCDVCPENHRAAVKSCVVCVASFCDSHLEPHYMDAALGRHRLVSAWKNLEDSVCRLHGRQLDRFCRSDQTCICALCGLEDHRGHRMVTTAKEATRKRVKLRTRMARLAQTIEERQSQVENVRRCCVDLCEDAVGRRRASCGEEIIRDLEEEITVLHRRKAELEEISLVQDHLHFLQRFLHTSVSDIMPGDTP